MDLETIKEAKAEADFIVADDFKEMPNQPERTLIMISRVSRFYDDIRQ